MVSVYHTSAGDRSRTPAAGVAVAAVLDLAAVVVFVLAGRRSHGLTMADVGTTITPFAIGVAAGWAVARAHRAAWSVRVGATVAAVAVAVGMLLRNLVFGDGTALSFVVVAAVFMLATMVGWRVVAAWIRAR